MIVPLTMQGHVQYKLQSRRKHIDKVANMREGKGQFQRFCVWSTYEGIVQFCPFGGTKKNTVNTIA